MELSALDESNPFCTPNVDVSNFLNIHSKSNHEDICLAYVFTYRLVFISVVTVVKFYDEAEENQ